MTPEFDLIARYFTRPVSHTDLGIGDDAALISVPEGSQLAVSADMLVSGTHFFADEEPYRIGWKSLAVNVSDMAAMGAEPKWATLALALPQADPRWLDGFSRGFFDCAQTFDIDLIGGDTTRGPLTVSIQIMGLTSRHRALSRANAQAGDDIWVSGPLGGAALALAHLQGRYPLPSTEFEACSPSLYLPQPRVALGLALRDIAHSAIDISDGLVADLGHILQASAKGAEICLADIPVILPIQQRRGEPLIQQMILAGGDDYELCFTASPTYREQISSLARSLHLTLGRIGIVTENRACIVIGEDGQIRTVDKTGYDHFSPA